jgi:hypothetical protein
MVSTAAMAAVITPVSAHSADEDTLSAMQDQCDARALAHGAGWTGTLDEASISASYVAGPVENPGTRDRDASTVTGTGTFTPWHTYIQGSPFRIGGSVNMFGDQYADSGSWSDSTYYYDAEFNSTYAFAFACNMSQSVYHPVVGHYVIEPRDHGKEEDTQQSCEAFNDKTPVAPTYSAPPWWGTDQAQCDFVTTTPAGFFDEERPDENGTPVNQIQADTLHGFEEHGGAVDAPGGTYHIGQVVICISPGKPTPGGAWRQQNGYTGADCNTNYFKNTAKWGSGTESSNGTYISVPNYN